MSEALTAREAAERLAGPGTDREGPPALAWARTLLQNAHAASRVTLSGRLVGANGRLGPRSPLPRDYFEDGALDLGEDSAGPDGRGDFARLEAGMSLQRWAVIRVGTAEITAEAARIAGGPEPAGRRMLPGWAPGPGETCKEWVQRPVVVSEAQGRKNARHKGKISLNGALWTMAVEVEAPWDQKTISITCARLWPTPKVTGP